MTDWNLTLILLSALSVIFCLGEQTACGSAWRQGVFAVLAMTVAMIATAPVMIAVAILALAGSAPFALLERNVSGFYRCASSLAMAAILTARACLNDGTICGASSIPLVISWELNRPLMSAFRMVLYDMAVAFVAAYAVFTLWHLIHQAGRARREPALRRIGETLTMSASIFGMAA